MKQSTISRSSRYAMAAFHGVFMLYGWWFFGAVALLFARYFKGMFPSTKWFGEAVWYQFHRDLFIASLVLQVVGFILVFINAGRLFYCQTTTLCESKDYALTLHTWLGIVCTALALLEPFYAWVRPDGDSKWRLTFNWAHWLAGQLSFVLATVTMFLGIPLGKTGLRRLHGYTADYLMGSFVVAYLLTSVVLEFASSRDRRKNAVGAPSEMKMAVMNGPTKTPATRQPAYSTVRVALMVVFSMYSLAVCTVLSYMLLLNGLAAH